MGRHVESDFIVVALKLFHRCKHDLKYLCALIRLFMKVYRVHFSTLFGFIFFNPFKRKHVVEDVNTSVVAEII